MKTFRRESSPVRSRKIEQSDRLPVADSHPADCDVGPLTAKKCSLHLHTASISSATAGVSTGTDGAVVARA
jgi:hypothetical protein